ncbi:amino acid ABC transporter permease [Vagococcus penaei]|uniref:ABC transporter permease subunit n=1 Tax=Vagococcus penaei TaxID=633807 RepID=UPI000F87F0EE|nr:ABC transporter permease subunit [Vagococcus penaei]RSU02880.1 amino acid ABC transporter permease [Vagococcus penaei]
MTNKRTITIFWSLVLFLSSFFLLTNLGYAADKEKFTVGMEAGYPPFNWTQKDDSNGAVPIQGSKDYAGGYDVKIAQKIADDLDKELVIFKTEWDGLAPALTSGKIDAIIAGMSPTAERKKTVDFTDVYYNSNLVMLVNSEGNFTDAKSLADFKDAKITGQLNTFHYSVIDQIPGVKKQTAMDNFPAMRVALESGKIDGYVTERPEGVTAQTLNPKFKMIEFEAGKGFNTSPDDTAIAIGLRYNDPDKAKINQLLASISADDRTKLMDQAISQQPNMDDNGSEQDEVNEADQAIVGQTEKKSNEPWVIRIARENGKAFLRGAGTTLLISLVGTIVGTIIGLAIGIFRTLKKPTNTVARFFNKLLNILFSVYIEIFRGTPMIVQAMVIYYGSAQAFNIDINPLVAALFIVSINTGAYMTEIIRGGIYAVDKGQFEAAEAIGMTHAQTMWNVVIPQVFRNTLPAIGNEFVINIKDTSVLNVIAVSELYFQAKTVAGSNFRFFDTFFVVCVIYFVMTFTVTRILRYIERRIDGNDSGSHMSYANQMQVQETEKRGA